MWWKILESQPSPFVCLTLSPYCLVEKLTYQLASEFGEAIDVIIIYLFICIKNICSKKKYSSTTMDKSLTFQLNFQHRYRHHKSISRLYFHLTLLTYIYSWWLPDRVPLLSLEQEWCTLFFKISHAIETTYPFGVNTSHLKIDSCIGHLNSQVLPWAHNTTKNRKIWKKKVFQKFVELAQNMKVSDY